MIKNCLLSTLLVFCLISCKKSSNIEDHLIKSITAQPVAVDKTPNLAYIAVVNASGDTLRSNPVRITELN